MTYIKKICENCDYSINQSSEYQSFHWCDDGNKYEMIPDFESLSNQHKGVLE